MDSSYKGGEAVEKRGTSYSGPVLFYTDEVIDHFTHPRNVGSSPRRRPTASPGSGIPPAGTR